jgi:hypothetical protein
MARRETGRGSLGIVAGQDMKGRQTHIARSELRGSLRRVPLRPDGGGEQVRAQRRVVSKVRKLPLSEPPSTLWIAFSMLEPPTPKAFITQHGTPGWDLMWQNSNTPWDKGDGNPHLVSLLTDPPKEVAPLFEKLRGGRALVPGCGRVRRRLLLQ